MRNLCLSSAGSRFLIGLPGSSLPLLPTETGDSIEYSSERTVESGVFCLVITIDGDSAKVELIELCGCCNVAPEVELSADGVSTLVFTIVCCKSVSIENDDDGGGRVRLLLIVIVFVLLMMLPFSHLLDDS